MPELYSHMGFRENPFSRFSAEEEKDYLTDIFVQPKYYPTIHDDIKSGSSRFVFGERGVGKSALVITLLQDFKNEHVFSILIDDYETVPVSDNGRDLLILTLTEMTTSLGLYLLNNRKAIKNLSKIEKEKLALVINTFFETMSQSQFNELYEGATHNKSKNIFKRVLNYFVLRPVNAALSGCSEFIGTTISRALGLNQPISNAVYKEFLSEFKETPASEKIDPQTLEVKNLKNILFELSKIVKKCGFKGVVIIYDKIDEYRQLGTKAASIAEFVKDLALDTSMLLNESASFVFSFWSRIKSNLVDFGVRTDKLKPIDISWSSDELRKIINDRIHYFSDGKLHALEQIMPEEYIEAVLDLSHLSPRHLIILLSRIYDEQATTDDKAPKFSEEAVEKGLKSFATDFDFVTFYAGINPSTIKKTINEIIKIHKTEFETKDLINSFKISSQAANNKIKIMQNFGFIEDITAGTRAKSYRVVEPRLCYIIQKNYKVKF